MQAKKFLLTALILIVLIGPANATTYYVDFENGNNNYAGTTTQTAWKHAPGDPNASGNAAAVSLQPGDTILFKGGIAYRGTISVPASGSQGNPITYKGDGWGSQKAILEGSVPVKGWYQCQTQDECGGNSSWQNIYYTYVSSDFPKPALVANLYQGDEPLFLSQLPDIADPIFRDLREEYWSISKDNVSSTHIIDPRLDQFGSSLIGSYVFVWRQGNAIDFRKITAYVPSESKIIFEQTTKPPYDDRDTQYSIVNNLHSGILNRQGEYFLNETAEPDGTHKVYLWPYNNEGPDQSEITISALPKGIGISYESYIVVEGFKIQRQGGDFYSWGACILCSGADHISIRNNEVTKTMADGLPSISIKSSSDILVENNHISYACSSNGLEVKYTSNPIIRNNNFYKVNGGGLIAHGNSNVQIINNTLDKVKGAHGNAISAYGSETVLIKGNRLSDTHHGLTMEKVSGIGKDYTVVNNIFDLRDWQGYCVSTWGSLDGTNYFLNNILLGYYGTNHPLNVQGTWIVKNNIVNQDLADSSNFNLIGVDFDTVFMDYDNYDLRHKPGSPTIDAGDDVSAYGVTDDIEGTARPRDGDGSGTAEFDVGAYEYRTGELSVSDFKFDGEFGSKGATIEKIGKNHFKVTLSHTVGHPTWSNMLGFQITGNAKGNTLRIDGCFDRDISEQDFKYKFYSNYQSWSYDGENWQPKGWGGSWDGRCGKYLNFPTFTEDQVYVGFQIPLSHEDVLEMINEWEKSPYVTTHLTGQSLQGRDIYRIEITDPNSPHPREDRWVHWFQNEHPLEHNAQWRMVGMIEWLLSSAGADMRQRSICHFKIMLGPDGPSNGWLRTNVEGVDLAHDYLHTGADPASQTHESYIGQKDLEEVMASETPVTDIWSMHTWGGPVDPAMILGGPEIDSLVGPWTELDDIVQSNDPNDLIEPFVYFGTGETIGWSGGPYYQFGITDFQCEGGIKKVPSYEFFTKEDCKEAGVILLKSLGQYYEGTKSTSGSCVAGQTRSCDTGLSGVCSKGTQTCQTDETWGNCIQKTQPLKENCSDGLDNDCDDKTDCSDLDCSADPACQTTIPANCVAWWKFEGNANDETKKNDGTAFGNPGFVPGKIGRALEFDGTDDYIQVQDDDSLANNNNEMTWTWWANPSSLMSNRGIINKYETTTNQRSYAIHVYSGTDKTLNINISNDGTANSGHIDSSSTPANYLIPNQWHHYAITFDSGAVKFYRDGSEFHSDNMGIGTIYNSTAPLLIGKWTYSWDGMLDEVRIYNKALNSQQIQAIYNEATECVDTPALMNYIGQWKQGQITMLALMQKIGKWKTGTGC